MEQEERAIATKRFILNLALAQVIICGLVTLGSRHFGLYLLDPLHDTHVASFLLFCFATCERTNEDH